MGGAQAEGLASLEQKRSPEWMGTEDNKGLVNLAARRGSRSVLLASLFSLNEKSRSAQKGGGL